MIDESIFQHHTVTLDDVRLHYVIAGRGEPVVLLHGWPQTWFEWRRIIPALATKYTVIAPDMMGLQAGAAAEAIRDAATAFTGRPITRSLAGSR
jgi:pimeloyl-ACP methyl ester carboxylesterase